MSASIIRARRTTRIGLDWLPLTCILAAFLAVNLAWVYRYRPGQPYEIDEAGYLTYALIHARALASGGIWSWIQSIEAPGFQAPFVLVLTSLVFTVAGTHPSLGFVVMAASGAVVVWATFFIARQVGGYRTAVASSVLVACSPIILNGARAYNFGLPAAAVTTIALLALLRSEGLQRVVPSLAFGLLLGLMPLTRTMAIAYLPGLALPALIGALCSPDRRRSLLLLAGAALVSVATMATWLAPNGRYVLEYLTSYGYGSRATIYGPALSGAYEQAIYMVQFICAWIYLPQFLILAAGLLCLAGVGIAQLMQRPGMAIAAFWRAPVLAPLVLAAEGLAALTTTQNKGSFFLSPLVPAMVVLAVHGLLCATRRGGFARRAAYAAIAAAALWPAVTMADLDTPLAWPRAVELSMIGRVTVSDGSGPVQMFERSAGYRSDNPAMPVSTADGRAWLEALRRSGRELSQRGGERSVSALGARGYLFNTNALVFVWMFDGHAQLPLVQASPEAIGQSAADYRRFLTVGDAAGACQLLTASGTIGEIQPAIDPDAMREAAALAGFTPGTHWALPDGREVTSWSRPAEAASPCPHG